MQFDRPTPPRPARENIVPMINVVFLLLIFFLMTAQIAPPDPFEVTPPASDADTPAEGPAVLHVAADGALAYGTARDGEVWAALTADRPEGPLLLRADGAVPADRLAGLLSQIRATGVDKVQLVTRRAP